MKQERFTQFEIKKNEKNQKVFPSSLRDKGIKFIGR